MKYLDSHPFGVPVSGRDSCPSKCEWIDRHGRCVQCGKQQNLELGFALGVGAIANGDVDIKRPAG